MRGLGLVFLSLVSLTGFSMGPAKVSAIKAEFYDFGDGGSRLAQKEALAIIGAGISEGKIGKFEVLSIFEHGEIAFCIQGYQYFGGSISELSSIFAELETLLPKAGSGYGMSLEALDLCP